MNYQKFLASKRIHAQSHGIEIDKSKINSLLFPFQRDIVAWALHKGQAAIFADTGLGKALPIDSKVLTPTGYTPIGNLSIEDLVIGPNGESTRVIGIYPQGVRNVYQVNFSDGTSARCDIEHLWNVRTKVQKYRGQDFYTMTLQQILDNGLRSQEGWKYFIPMVEPIYFQATNLSIHPYLLGVLIGDGSLSAGMPCVSSADDELLNDIAGMLPEGLQLLQNTTDYDWRISSGSRNGHRINPLTQALRDIGLMGKKSESKFIPNQYLFASIESRKLILQGLLDTDGHVRPADNNIEYCTVSEQLAKDVAFIVQSLGGIARIRTKKTTGQLAYRMSVILPDGIEPFRLSRKANTYHPRVKYQPTRAIVSIESVGKKEMVCIAVDSPDSCYVIEHCIVTHNTFMQVEWARLISKNALIIAPLNVSKQTIREALKLGVTVQYVKEQAEITKPGIWITNYERLDSFNFEQFDAVVLDESSILKSLDGKTRRKLTDACQDVKYRLCCTATPAPNDQSEIGNHAEFLSVCSMQEMLAMFFVHANHVIEIRVGDKVIHNKQTGKKGQEWRLKYHAKEAFFRWLASWGIFVRKPSNLGYADDGFILPELKINPVFVESNYVPDGKLFFTGLHGIQDRNRVRKSTKEERARVVYNLVMGDN